MWRCRSQQRARLQQRQEQLILHCCLSEWRFTELWKQSWINGSLCGSGGAASGFCGTAGFYGAQWLQVPLTVSERRTIINTDQTNSPFQTGLYNWQCTYIYIFFPKKLLYYLLFLHFVFFLQHLNVRQHSCLVTCSAHMTEFDLSC